jgi:hypothetical protein
MAERPVLSRTNSGHWIATLPSGLWNIGETKEIALDNLEEEKRELELYMNNAVIRVNPVINN